MSTTSSLAHDTPRLPRRAALGRLARRLVDGFPITALGLLVLGLSAAGFYFLGVLAMDYVALILAGTLGVAVLVDGVLVFAVSVALRMRLGRRRRARASLPPVEPLRGETLTPMETAFSLRAAVPLVRFRWGWDHASGAPRPDARVELVPRTRWNVWLGERVTFQRRGILRGVTRRVVVESVLGFSRVAFRAEGDDGFDVLPRPLGLRRTPVLLSLAGGEDLPHPLGTLEGDRVDLRRYEAGDPARFIHWKVFARSRRLMVRMHERALTRTDRIAAFLVAGPEDEASAAAARVAVEGGALGENFRFAASGDGTPVDSVDAARERILRSAAWSRPASGGPADAPAGGAVGLEEFIARVEREGPVSFLFFVPPVPGPWLGDVVRKAGARPGRTRVVVALDGLAPSPSGRARSVGARLRGWLLRTAQPVGVPSEALAEVLAAFASVRVPVLVLDRPFGRVWPGGRMPVAPAEELSTSRGRTGRAA